MKPLKSFLNVLFAIASVFSFLSGWVMFSRAGKPAPLISPQTLPDPQVSVTNTTSDLVVTPLPTLKPLPTLTGSTNANTAVQSQSSNLQALPVVPSTNNNARVSQPRFRTRGS
jgi:hypothetical protein